MKFEINDIIVNQYSGNIYIINNVVDGNYEIDIIELKIGYPNYKGVVPTHSVDSYFELDPKYKKKKIFNQELVKLQNLK